MQLHSFGELIETPRAIEDLIVIRQYNLKDEERVIETIIAKLYNNADSFIKRLDERKNSAYFINY